MEVKEKIFPCLNCGSDTGCPSELICDNCRVLRRQKPAPIRGRKIERKKSRLQMS